MHIPTSTPCLE